MISRHCAHSICAVVLASHPQHRILPWSAGAPFFRTSPCLPVGRFCGPGTFAGSPPASRTACSLSRTVRSQNASHESYRFESSSAASAASAWVSYQSSSSSLTSAIVCGFFFFRLCSVGIVDEPRGRARV